MGDGTFWSGVRRSRAFFNQMENFSTEDSALSARHVFASSRPPRLWFVNSDFEAELAAHGSRYFPRPIHEAMNQRLAFNLARWLARPGDGILAPEAWHAELRHAAGEHFIDPVSLENPPDQSHRIFTPWGRTPRADAVGVRTGALLDGPSPEVVRTVNSKSFSHRLERELGVAEPDAAECATFDELARHVAATCSDPEMKWVIKHPFGVAARERVLGRGPTLGKNAETWCRKAFERGEPLIFEPWLDVIREYGTVMNLSPTGEVEIFGISDVQANGAGTATGYLIGRPPTPERGERLFETARLVGAALRRAGYFGPCGLDALEHRGGLRPLLEINARFTVGFLAVAAERRLNPTGPTPWALTELPR